MTQGLLPTTWVRGIVAAVLLLAFSAILPAQTPTVSILVNFDSANGANPYAPTLVQATNGNFYGTTDQGGANSAGTVFDVTSQGSLTTLLSLCCQSIYAVGNAPGGLTQAVDGVLYGTTALGGLNTCKIDVVGDTGGCGTIFQFGLGGELTTLYNFGGADGASPGGLVQGTDGNLYGTTSFGGAYNQLPYVNGYGTVFKFVPGLGLTTLYSFCAFAGCPDGFNPGPLVQGADGNFYGVTANGGGGIPPGTTTLVPGGTIFKITPQGALTTLYNFCSQTSCSDGAAPSALMQASNGDFYGTTSEGGMDVGNSPCNDIGGLGGDGTIFEMIPGSAPVTLHSFDGADGATPNAALVQASDGNLYGTTACGGANGAGTIFQITSAGVFTSLYSFTGSPGVGGGVQGGLLQATNGTFYGTTPAGGTDSDGTVFSLSMGLNPFVETLPTSGGVGAPVLILGNNLTGATDVSFNGRAATFTVVSDSEIETTVPAGAAAGSVLVTTQSATLNSNVPFQVTSQMVAATPTISPAAGDYASAQTATITDATAGVAIYYTTDGSTPTTASNLYSGAFAIPSSEALQAIALSSTYSASGIATAAYTIENPSNPAPILSSLSPAFTTAGGAAFTLTVNGSAFTAQSTIYSGSSALATEYVSATQLSTEVTAAEIATAGTTAVTVQTPTPGGGKSNALQFEVGAAGGAAPAFTTLTVFVNPGSTATYPVTLPSSVTNISVACLNLPSGANCSYSLTGAVTITTSSATPLGTYQITVVFSETVPGAATALVLLPILLLPLAIARKRWASRGARLLVCLGFALILTAAISGCGGGKSGGGGGSQTHPATSFGAVTLIVQ